MRVWNEEEDGILEEFIFSTGGVKIIEERTGRSISAIHSRAIRLGKISSTFRPHGVDSRGRVTKEVSTLDTRKLPRNLPDITMLHTMVCVGNGNGPCGQRLYMEHVFPDRYSGYRPKTIDLSCGTHRHFFQEFQLVDAGMIPNEPMREDHSENLRGV